VRISNVFWWLFWAKGCVFAIPLAVVCKSLPTSVHCMLPALDRALKPRATIANQLSLRMQKVRTPSVMA